MKIADVTVALSTLALSSLPSTGQEKQTPDAKEASSSSIPTTNGESEPHSADEAYRRAGRFLQSRRVDDAIAMFSRAIVLKPDWAEAFAARGRALYQAKRYADAIKDFDEAIRLEAGNAAWYNSRGLAYSYSSQHAKAIEDYARAIELSPATAAYYNNRGWAYSDLGQFESAMTDLSRAIQLAPDYARAYENRATVYFRMKDWPHAIADYTAAIQIGPTPLLYQRRADAKLAAGDQAGAEEDRSRSAMQQAASPSPPAPGAAFRIGNGVTPPRVSYKVEPNYSEEARLGGLEGTVVLFVVVGPDGTPRDLRVVKSLGLGLDEKAIEAVSQWKFLPGAKDGQAVAVQATIQVNFRFLDRVPADWRLERISFQPPVGASRPQLVSAKRPSKADPGESASITISFEVGEDGVPVNLHVDTPTDPKLERKMLEAVRAWRFKPSLREGKAVSTHCTLSFAPGESSPK